MSETFQDPYIGKVFLGRYRIVDRLAKGGMGVVYLGRAEGADGFRRPVVIKLISPDFGIGEDTTGMFLREAKVLARLQHPNIVSIVDFGHEAGVHVMVLEYIRGYPLSSWYRFVREEGVRTPIALACFIVEEILRALQFVHGVQTDGRPDPVVHRDISPSNVLLTPDGYVKLVDFGIAKGNDTAGEYKTTDDHSVKGKFAYMAPELFQSQPATPQSDLYACGVVLRELLVGRNDFRGRDLSDTVQRVMKHEPEQLGSLRADVSPELDAFLAQAHAKRPSARFRDATEMLTALRSLRDATLEDTRELLSERLTRDFEILPARMRTERLDARDALWRDREFAREISEPPPTKVARPPVASLPETSRPPEPSPTSPRRWIGPAAAAIAVIAAGTGALLVRQEQPPPLPVLVADSHSAQAPTAEVEAPVMDLESDPAPVVPPPHMATKNISSSVSPAALRQALTRQQAALRRCFERHGGADVPDEVILRARIAASGRVDQAEVLAPSVARSALGGCLVAAAHDLEFEPRRAPVFFRIPLRPQ